MITQYQPSLNLHNTFVLREKRKNNFLREFYLSKPQSSEIVEKPRKVRITLSVPSFSRGLRSLKTRFLSTIYFEAHEVEMKSLIPSYAKQKEANFLKGKPEDRKW